MSRNPTETARALAHSLISSAVYKFTVVMTMTNHAITANLRLAIVPGSLICLMACPSLNFPHIFYPATWHLDSRSRDRGSSSCLHLHGRSSTPPKRRAVDGRVAASLLPCRKAFGRRKRQSEREHRESVILPAMVQYHTVYVSYGHRGYNHTHSCR